MMAKEGHTLYQVQLLDTELAGQASKLREAEGMLGESPELIAAREAYEKASQELAKWHSRLRDLEFDLQQVEEKIVATEQRLYGGQVTNPKELRSLQLDHEQQKRTQQKLEDDALLAMTRVDELDKRVRESQARWKAVEAKWQREQAQLRQQIEQLRDRMAAAKKQRAMLMARLEPATRALYEELLRKKDGRAVVLMADQMCQGCRVTVPTSKAQIVRRGLELVTCTNCGRILVVQD
ncbi:MAG: zinc ribbon domain-containing protein [Anaerolineae bacterium]